MELIPSILETLRQYIKKIRITFGACQYCGSFNIRNEIIEQNIYPITNLSLISQMPSQNYILFAKVKNICNNCNNITSDDYSIIY